jgi:type II secretory pathway pseudopilin PulG
MTLLELLIGIVITGAAVAAGYATFSTLVDQQQRAKFVIDDVARGAAIRRALVGWIQNGRVQLGSGNVPRGGLNLGMQSARDELRVFAVTPTPIGSMAVITLFVNTNDATLPPGLVAQFTMPFNNFPDSATISIDSTVTGMRVEYLTEQLNVRQWYTADELGEATVRPLAVRLWFLSNDPRQLTPLMHLPLTVPLSVQ